ncbi:MAG: FkbM family methyltransferase [Anaerolineae bacterium]|nr:FkbM family methyltransferase [Anaerolineae bacterium]
MDRTGLRSRLIALTSRLGLFRPAAFLRRSLTTAGRQTNAQLRQHEADMVSLYRHFVQSGDLCFDIGANNGNRVEVFLRLGANVVAVEPQPACVDYLHARYGHRAAVHIVAAGLDAQPGQADLFIGSNKTMSSMSADWIAHIKTRDARHAARTWTERITVPVTTLDALIERFGVPRFVKIDVEGFEYQIISGLSRPLAAVSIEYTPEHLDPAFQSIRRLNDLGSYEFNYAVGETMQLILPEWVDPHQMEATLRDLAATHQSGDIYARLKPSSP